MTYLRLFRNVTRMTPIVLIFTASAMAEWKRGIQRLPRRERTEDRFCAGGRK